MIPKGAEIDRRSKREQSLADLASSALNVGVVVEKTGGSRIMFRLQAPAGLATAHRFFARAEMLKKVHNGFYGETAVRHTLQGPPQKYLIHINFDGTNGFQMKG